MTPTLRHAHRTALYQRRQLLRQTRREQQPDPVWFHGIGTLTYRGGQRPMPHPQLSLGQRVWQGTTTGVWHGVQRGRQRL